MKIAFRVILLALLIGALPAPTSFGGVRHFTFLYEAPTSAPGSIELENTVTWGHRSNWNDVFVREELEIGITDRFQLGIYPLDWSHHSDDGFEYNGGAVELIYNLSNPVIDPVGISLYEEINAARQHFESESKLIAQKNFGRWILDYNVTLEAEWESKGLEEQSGELQQALGASYEISPRLSVGVEFLARIRFSGLGRQNHKRFRRSEYFLSPAQLVCHRDRSRTSNGHV